MSNQNKPFIPVCKTNDLEPGGRLAVEVGRKWIVLFNVGGTIYALEDMCSHDEVPLSDGVLIDETTIECAAHGACFDIRTGAVKAPPAVVGVKRFAVQVIGDDVQVQI